MKPKTRKSLTKRFKVTKNGKILRRKPGQTHYRAKMTGQEKRETKKWVDVHETEVAKIKKGVKR